MRGRSNTVEDLKVDPNVVERSYRHIYDFQACEGNGFEVDSGAMKSESM